MTSRAEIDTSEEAAKEITNEIIHEVHGPDWVASKSDVRLTRHILLTVAAMSERQQAAAQTEREHHQFQNPEGSAPPLRPLGQMTEHGRPREQD